MLISIIICSRDRAQSLGQTLNSIFVPTNLAVPGWEVLVAYGPNESGETEICKRLDERFPGRLRYWLRKEEGKSGALNTAFDLAHGEIFALTDDDVTVAPDFIAAIQSTFHKHQVDGVQGRIFLDCEGGRPVWMGEELSRWMSDRDYGDKTFEWKENLNGSNMLIRAEVVKKIGGFAIELGAGAVGFAEDSEFSSRMRKAGCKMLYVPEIVVWHRLPADRLTETSFRERAFRMGKTEAYLLPLPTAIWRFGFYSFRKFLLGYLQSFWFYAIGRSADAVLKQCDAFQRAGMFWQYFMFRRKGRAHAPYYKTQVETE